MNQECLKTALRLLNYKFYASWQLQEKLEARDFTSEDILEVLDHLKTKKFLDDHEYIGARTRGLMRKRYSKSMIAHRLKRDGIAQEKTYQILEEHCYSEEQSAQSLAEKKIIQLQKREPDLVKRKQKLHFFLRSKGFSSACIQQAIAQVFKDTSEY